MNTQLLFEWSIKIGNFIVTIGGIGFFVELCRRGFKWIRRNLLSKEEIEILKKMIINNDRVLFKPERSDFPLHIKMEWGTKPWPSEDKTEIVKYYEKFLELIDKGFIRHAEGEIFTLTLRGRKMAIKMSRTGDKSVDKAFEELVKS